MRACFIIDPFEALNPYKDSSIDMMIEGQGRGITPYVCEATDVVAGSDGVSAVARRVTLDPAIREGKTMDPALYSLAAAEPLDLASCKAIFIRKDPPFDQTYLSLTLLLEPLEKKVVFLNSPRGVRAISEKLSALHFPDHIPQTLVSYRPDALHDFAKRYDKVVLKPCYYGSGKGVAISQAADPAFGQHVDTILALEPRGPVIAQEFLPEVAEGDARVMMVNGHVVGAVGRKPPEGDFRANIAVGGTEFQADLSPTQRQIAEDIGPYLRDNGIVFAGLDFIGTRLIEINVTSPTLIQELRRVGGPNVSTMIWDALLA